MAEITDFGLIVLAVSGFLALAVFTNKLSERFPIPAPAIFLLAAALAARLSRSSATSSRSRTSSGSRSSR